MKKVLVIEDNKNNQYLLRFILRQNGYTVIEANSGIEGIGLALKDDPDLILMDIQLPDVDGLEATKRIRASKVDRKIPIIALTSYAMTGDKQLALDAGCTGYISKPINPDTFINEIQTYFSDKNVSGEKR
jgi:two-component system, cell cycle response regulator DivK